MRKLLFVSILVVALMMGGCDEMLAGFGAGVAGNEALQSWQENLEAKKAALQEQYDLVMKEIESAPDPNVLALARKKLEPLSSQMLANAVALHTVTKIIDVQEQGNPENNRDAIFTGGIGLALIVLEELSRRKLGKKYTSSKAGQAKFIKENPEPGKALYADVGYERQIRGL